MKFKKLLFIFTITLLSIIAMVGCTQKEGYSNSEDNNQSKEQATNDAAHGHSH